MIDRRSVLLGFLSLILLYIALPAIAQQADDSVIRIQGVFQKLDGQTITVQSADGTSTDIHLTTDTVVTRNEPSTLADVKPGDFVASAAKKGDDGKLHSIEVRIFPSAMNGLGEGQRPMQDTSKTMTNAKVTEVVAAPEGQILKVKFQDNTSELVVGPNVPVIRVVVGAASDLKVGSNVFVSATKGPDGTLSAKRVFTQ